MKKDKFQLDVTGGAVVLQRMMKPTVEKATKAAAERTKLIFDRYNKPVTVEYEVGAPNKHGGLRYHGVVRVNAPTALRRSALQKTPRAVIDAARKAVK